VSQVWLQIIKQNFIINMATDRCTLLSHLAVEVSFQQAVYTVMESGDAVEVCVVLSGILGLNVTISLSTSNGSAVGMLKLVTLHVPFNHLISIDTYKHH